MPEHYGFYAEHHHLGDGGYPGDALIDAANEAIDLRAENERLLAEVERLRKVENDALQSGEMVKVRWWWGRNRRKSARWAAEMRRQDEQRRIRLSTPTAYVLDIVNNGPPHGWKWLVWDYDPDNTRLMAGQVEGVLVPHGMKDGYATALDALTAGLGAIRNGGWTGDVVLREKVPSVGTEVER